MSAAALGPRRGLGLLAGLGGRASGRVRDELAAPARRVVLGGLDATLSGLDSALTSPLAQEVLDRILASAFADDLLDRIVSRIDDSPEAERLVGRVIDSRLVDVAMLQLLESEGLWTLVDQIARSPAVLEAVSSQGVGFANQMAGVVRDRSRMADDRLETLVRQVARRGRRADVPPPGAGPDQSP
jgi:hypothetical protein